VPFGVGALLNRLIRPLQERGRELEDHWPSLPSISGRRTRRHSGEAQEPLPCKPSPPASSVTRARWTMNMLSSVMRAPWARARLAAAKAADMSSSGSPRATITIGIVQVAFFTRWAAGV